MLIMQMADFVCRNKFINAFPTYLLTLICKFLTFLSDLEMKAD